MAGSRCEMEEEGFSDGGYLSKSWELGDLTGEGKGEEIGVRMEERKVRNTLKSILPQPLTHCEPWLVFP